MSEIGTVDGLLIGIECHIAPDGTPQTCTVEGYYILGLTLHLTYIEGKLLTYSCIGYGKATGLGSYVALSVEQLVGLHILGIGSLGVLLEDVEGGEYLLFLVKLNILLLHGLQYR